MNEQSMQSSSLMTYLAGPIRSIGEDAFTWRMCVGDMLSLYGFASFDPASAFIRPETINRSTCAGVESINRRAIDVSGFIIANLDKDSWNIGTIREIEYARSQNIPVIVVCPEASALQGKISAHDLEIVPTIDHAVARVTGEPLGKVQVAINEWYQSCIERNFDSQYYEESTGEAGGVGHEDSRQQSTDGESRSDSGVASKLRRRKSSLRSDRSKKPERKSVSHTGT